MTEEEYARAYKERYGEEPVRRYRDRVPGFPSTREAVTAWGRVTVRFRVQARYREPGDVELFPYILDGDGNPMMADDFAALAWDLVEASFTASDLTPGRVFTITLEAQ